MTDERDEIRSRISIVELVGASIPLKRAGRDWKGLCPFHADKNPSFTVSERLGTYRCWSCGEKGDVFQWVMKTRNVEFREALEILAEMAGITLQARGTPVDKSERARQRSMMDLALGFFREQFTRSPAAREYVARRALEPEIVEAWELGYAPDVGDALATVLKRQGHTLSEGRELFLVDEDSHGGFFDKFRGRLIFPIRDEKGDLVAFGGRLLGDGVPKYINSSDTPLYRKGRVLYGMHRALDALKDEKRAVLVEGYLDVIACHRAGVRSAVASLGTSLSEEHAKLLRRWCEEVVILYDADSAGQKAAERAIDVLQAEKVRIRVALMPEGEDPDTLLRTQGPAAVKRAVESGIRPVEFRLNRLMKRVPTSDEAFWPEAVSILAAEPSEMELDRQIVRLAGMYPNMPNPMLAQNALRRWVGQTRQRPGREPGRGRPAVAVSAPKLSELDAAEITIFRAVLEEPFRRRGWELCSRTDLFVTEAGRLAATDVRTTFSDSPPEGSIAVWLYRFEREELRDLFEKIESDFRTARLTMPYLEDAVKSLERRVEERQLAEMKQGEASKADIFKRLKELKPKYDRTE